MAMPLIIAFAILLSHERHLGLRQSLSDTQRIFTSSWWTGEQDTISGRDRPRRPPVQQGFFDPDAPLEVALASDNRHVRERVALRQRWLPASFVRFLWFCTALFIAMTAYVLGEAYAEIYLRTLPHNTFDTIFYVYSWVVTIHLLDGLVGFILGGNEGQRVGSYPLGWIFKLYVFPLSIFPSPPTVTNTEQLFLSHLPDIRPRPIRPPALLLPIHPPPNHLLHNPNNHRTPHHLRPLPLPPLPPLHQHPIPTRLSKILRPQHLHPRPRGKRLDAGLPRLHPRPALRRQQRRLPVLRIRLRPLGQRQRRGL